MKPARFHRIRVVLPVLVAIGIDIALGLYAGLSQTILLPLVIANAGAVIWSLLALSAAIRSDARTIREEAVTLQALAEDAHATAAMLAKRLTTAEQFLYLLSIEPEIAAAQRKLGQAADRVEAWQDLETSLPHWQVAVARWSAAVSRLSPDCAPTTEPASSAELRAARDQLPPTLNLSSGDLKAATGYFVQQDRIIAAYHRLEAYRKRIEEASARERGGP